ncbi:carbonyl reductase [NADPH] 1 [Stigmatopora argus]
MMFFRVCALMLRRNTFGEVWCAVVTFQRFRVNFSVQRYKNTMLSSRVVVVTGGNKGIGKAIVQALCRDFGGDVYLTARDQGRGQEAVASLSAEGLKVHFHQLDIDDVASIAKAAGFFKQKYGGVDVLVNNAGIAFKAADTSPFSVQAEVTLRTNYFATRDMLTHFLPLIKAGGRVVNVSSFVSVRSLNKCGPRLQERFRSPDITEEELTGLMEDFVALAKEDQHKVQGWPDTAYGVSKIGVTTLSMIHARRLSKERPNDKILVNACCPGWVRTDMAGPKATKSPEEGAETPVYLALLPADASEPHGKFVSEKTVQAW